jgi:phenylacetate-coenzyme A ligase PaaK-like adenylate-forming protein
MDKRKEYKDMPQKIKKKDKIQEQLIKSFKRAASKIPAYKKILDEKNINPEHINKLADFYKKVPIIEKKDIFDKFPIDELFIDKNIENIKTGISSSGFTNSYAFGIVFKQDIEEIKKMVDKYIEFLFNAKNNKVMIINANPMGVTFYSSYPIINTSVRSDLIIAFIKIFKQKFDEFIIIGDPHFLKKSVEDIKQNINIKDTKISLEMGGDWFSNSLVEYLMEQLDLNFNTPEKGQIRLTMGLTELGLNLFFDSPKLSKLRSILQKNKELRYKLLGKGIETVPELAYFDPNRIFVEIINKDKNNFGEIIISTLNQKARMPLFRYNSKDIGKIINLEKLDKTIKPELDLPIIALYGRKKSFEKKNNTSIADIKQALYKNNEITCYFFCYFIVFI